MILKASSDLKAIIHKITCSIAITILKYKIQLLLISSESDINCVSTISIY